jgi:hypothetical protein
MSDLAPPYEKLAGPSVVVRFEQTAAMYEKINSGAAADIATTQPEQVDNLIARKWSPAPKPISPNVIIAIEGVDIDPFRLH